MPSGSRERLQFEILGPLRVSAADGALGLGAPAQHALLAVLLTSPNAPVSDDRLVDKLWADDPPAGAHHLVQVYVSRLRALLDESPNAPRIVREASGYVLRVDRGALYDEALHPPAGARSLSPCRQAEAL